MENNTGDKASAEKVTVPQLIKRLESDDASTRTEATRLCAALAKRNPKHLALAVPTLARFINNGTGEIRWNAALTLVHIAEHTPKDVEPVVTDLLSQLDDESVDKIRGPIVQTLAYIAKDSPDSVEPAASSILALLKEECPARVPASRAVVHLAKESPKKVKTAIPTVRSLLIAENNVVQTNAVWALTYLARTYPEEVATELDQISELLESPDYYVRRQTTAAFAHLADYQPDLVSSVTEQLVDHLDDGPRIRSDASLTLARCTERNPTKVYISTSSLSRLLEDDDQQIRGNAALTLAWIARERPEEVRSVLPSLVQLLEDEYNFVRGNTALCIAYLAQSFPESIKSEIPTLIHLRDDSLFVRNNAILAIAQLLEAELDAISLPSDIEIQSSGLRTFIGEKDNTPVTGILAYVPDTATDEFEPSPSLLIKMLNEFSDQMAIEEAIDALAIVVEEYLKKEYPEEITPVAEDLIELLNETDTQKVPTVVISALAAITEKQPTLVEPAVSEVVPYLDREASQQSASQTLAYISSNDPEALISANAIGPLVELLQRSDHQLHRNVSLTLANIAQVVPAAVSDTASDLIALLDSADPQVRTNAAVALGYLAAFDVELVLPATEQCLELLDDEMARGPAAGVLAYIAEEDPKRIQYVTEQLIELLDVDKQYVRGNVAWTLASLAAEFPDEVSTAVPIIARLLNKGDLDEALLQILLPIAEVSPEEVKPVVPTLVSLLDNDNPEVRKQTCKILGRVNAYSVENQIRKLQNDPDPSVQLVAEQIVDQMTK